jgi:hypothetical protein
MVYITTFIAFLDIIRRPLFYLGPTVYFEIFVCLNFTLGTGYLYVYVP